MNHEQFVVPPGRRVRLASHDPKFTAEFQDEAAARESIRQAAENLARYQDILFAHADRAVLMLFQGMDAAGKDEAIQDVLSNVDPQGCKATKFEAPTKQELKHDYLRRFNKALPESGQIGIFNRSYYEQLTGDRVHRERLAQWKMQPAAKGEKLWGQRFQEVNNLEQYLRDNGVMVLKFFLHVSRERQRDRLLERTRLPDKKWRFSMSDMEDRKRWDQFMDVYEKTLQHTSTEAAPWYIIPADHRWFAHVTIASITAATLKSLHSRYPTPDKEQQKELARAEQQLKEK